jgi:hypothetical protein
MPTTPLLEAAGRGDLLRVRAEIAAGADLEVRPGARAPRRV